MKTIEVVCGALVKDGRVLIARRVSDVADGWYEFPGGKIEPGETD
nr:NUDIX domain-containing protein [uncultured Faecalibaculum sp.]